MTGAITLQRPRVERIAQRMPALIDPLGRSIRYLRLSVTDRCGLRCRYCMAEDARFAPSPELLSIAELGRVARAFVRLGVTKIRLTGGEPLVRRGVIDLVRALGQLRLTEDANEEGRLETLTLTTNGTQLANVARDLVGAGVTRINVSLDSLNTTRFRAITRGGDLSAVLTGITEARRAGLDMRINAVALKGVNEDELGDLVQWAGDQGCDLALIETMPLGEIGTDRAGQFLPLTIVRRRLEQRFTLVDSAETTGGPARYARVRETGRRVGFISPLTGNFCGGCNRVRVTATGRLVLCLGQDDGVELRPLLRLSDDDAALEAAIVAAIAHKPSAHDFVIARARPPAVARAMNVTGG